MHMRRMAATKASDSEHEVPTPIFPKIMFSIVTDPLEKCVKLEGADVVGGFLVEVVGFLVVVVAILGLK